MTATTLWGTLAARHRVPATVPLLIVLAVMLSRLYLGLHYLRDVLVGSLLELVLVVAAQRF
jgi:membrane-associated phospholipid phosphatase